MNITFVIGGAKSGKSSFVLKEASGIAGRKAFIATAEALDEEMKRRIEKHRVERGNEWDTFEEPVQLVSVLRDVVCSYKTVVIDCLTIWLSNIIARRELAEPDGKTVEESMDELEQYLREIKKGEGSDLYLVSNEVGMGIVPENKLARQFRDLAGTLNQKIAGLADEVYMVTAGIPVRIK
jgi:adenosylcobinamide kinase/adenosylcobinamide-phosphate guanylyltransferase